MNVVFERFQYGNCGASNHCAYRADLGLCPQQTCRSPVSAHKRFQQGTMRWADFDGLCCWGDKDKDKSMNCQSQARDSSRFFHRSLAPLRPSPRDPLCSHADIDLVTVHHVVDSLPYIVPFDPSGFSTTNFNFECQNSLVLHVTSLVALLPSPFPSSGHRRCALLAFWDPTPTGDMVKHSMRLRRLQRTRMQT